MKPRASSPSPVPQIRRPIADVVRFTNLFTYLLTYLLIRPTLLQWLPVLSHVAPPYTRRTEATVNFIDNTTPSCLLVLFTRTSSISSSVSLAIPSTNMVHRHSIFNGGIMVNSYITDAPTALVPAFDLPRHKWCLLKRFRAGTGRCAASLCQWGYTDNPLCICGDTPSTSHTSTTTVQ